MLTSLLIWNCAQNPPFTRYIVWSPSNYSTSCKKWWWFYCIHRWLKSSIFQEDLYLTVFSSVAQSLCLLHILKSDTILHLYTNWWAKNMYHMLSTWKQLPQTKSISIYKSSTETHTSTKAKIHYNRQLHLP